METTGTVETIGTVGTGVGGGNSTSIVPFVGGAGDWKRGGWRVLIGMAVAEVLGIVMIL